MIFWVTHSTVSEEEIWEACTHCSFDGIQLRCKELSDQQLLPLAQAARRASPFLTINTAIDVAIEVGADGVHLPEKMIEKCRQIEGISVSVSVHSLESALYAQSLGASSVTFGPIFNTPSKMGAPQGLEQLKQVASRLTIPVYAIGGITPSRSAPCLEAGACGTMMQSYFTSMLRGKESCL